jgi:hypothetical protein
MKSFLVNRNHQRASLRPAFAAIATLAAALTASNCAEAASRRGEQSVTSVDSRNPGEPIMAIVSLRSQRVTIYDAKGWILQAPVSSGQKGRETPAGIFSVIEKDEDHHSNLYDDAWMPHMQRITWSGVAMHGGPLPGYAASHGCIRLPYDFARRIFNLTPMGMRVIVAPSDVAPVEIAHPALAQFAQKPDAAASAAALAAEAKEATKRAEQARLAAVGVSREVARATVPVRTAENLKARADAQLAAAERELARARDPDDREDAERAKAKAAAKIAELEPQLEAAKAELQRKVDAAAPLREAAAAAESARVAAAEAARQAAGNLEPVSVFISRKTQRLYVRQAFKPILDAPVTIQDADRPIGTHVFTAAERTGNEAAVRWNVVSVDGGHSNELAEVRGRGSEARARDVEPVSVDPGAAKEALDRVTIPQDVLDRLGGMALPRSSLIISDEGLSSETGKGTEFVVLLNGQPQGGIKFRRHASLREPRYERPRVRLPYSRSPFAFPFSTW